jgi:hypothetical protein
MNRIPTLTWPGVTARRMARSGLVDPLAATPADVTRAICAAHAQILQAGEVSIARRAALTRADVERALWVDRTLVKTFGPRGTVHLVPTADLPMWTGALSSLPQGAPGQPAGVRFTPDEAATVIAAIGEALADAELTVDELTDELEARLGEWAVERTMDAFQDRWPRWRQLTSAAAHHGVLCFGRDRGRRTTYTSPHRWLPGFQPEPGESALRALLVSYLRAYGPATPQHLARWLAISTPAATGLFDALAERLRPVELEGTRMWTLAGDETAPDGPVPGVRLLPYFDAYVVAGQPRSLLYPGPAAARAAPTGQAGNYPVVLVDGVVRGIWHQRRSGRRLVITVEMLQPLRPVLERELEEEVALIGRILDADPGLVLGRVAVGPHA